MRFTEIQAPDSRGVRFPIRPTPRERQYTSDETRRGNACSWCMRNSLIIALIALLSSGAAPTVYAQALDGGARASALGNAGAALTGDAWAAANPAIWGTLDGRAVAFFTSQSFGLSELQYSAFEYVEPLSVGTIAAGVSTFGFSEFRDSRVHLGLARGFPFGSTRTALLGLRVQVGQIAIPGYGSRNIVGLTLGSHITVSETIDFGFAVENLVGSNGGDVDDLPASLSAGVLYTATETLRVVADARQEVGLPVELRVGMEFFPVPVLGLRFGAASQPSRVSGGVGVRLGLVSVDIAVQRHDVLGLTPAGGLSVLW